MLWFCGGGERMRGKRAAAVMFKQHDRLAHMSGEGTDQQQSSFSRTFILENVDNESQNNRRIFLYRFYTYIFVYKELLVHLPSLNKRWPV